METPDSNSLDPQQSLRIIQQALAHTRENILGYKPFFILWGWIVVFGSLGEYALAWTAFKPIAFVSWLLLIPVGWLSTYWLDRRLENKAPFKTSLEGIIATLWIILGCAMMLSIFMSIMLRIPTGIFPLFLAGVGLLQTARFLQANIVFWGGLLLVVGAVTMPWIPKQEIPLIAGLFYLIGYVIPAHRMIIRKE